MLIFNDEIVKTVSIHYLLLYDMYQVQLVLYFIILIAALLMQPLLLQDSLIQIYLSQYVHEEVVLIFQ